MSTQEDTSYVDANAVEDLVDSYESLSKYDRKQANEAKVRQQYINPLLRALGWDTTTDQVKPEQRTIVGDADYREQGEYPRL
jgi:predicted type IV restriction endonuclease